MTLGSFFDPPPPAQASIADVARSSLDRLIVRLSRGYRVRVVVLALAEEAIAAGLVVVFAALALPSHRTLVAALCGAGLLSRAVWLYAGTRIDVRRVDRRLGLGDRLTTWAALRGRRDGAALGWLGRELEARLAADPGTLGGRAAARRFRPARAALPVLVALILLALFAPPLPPGGLELPSDTLASAPLPSATRPEPRPQAGEGAEAPQPKGQDGQPRPVPPPDTGEEPEAPPPTDAPEADPKALLDDPALRDAFAVPQFVGAGEGETRMVPVAGLDETATAPPPPSPPSASGAPRVDPPDRARFEHALERALRARSIPEDERPFVRRWFSSLVDAAK